MRFRQFRLNLTLRLLLLLACLSLFVFLIRTNLYATIAALLAVILLQVWWLIRYLEKGNQKVIHFLESLRCADLSGNFSAGICGKTFDELGETMNQVIADFRAIRDQKEQQHHYLQAVVRHVGFGLMAFDETGTVELVNAAAKTLFDLPEIKQINDLAAVDDSLPDTLHSLGKNGRGMAHIERNGERLQMSLFATELCFPDRAITLVSFQNITAELENKELEAWQNMIRIFTHEIKNSLTPIASIASTIEDLVQPAGTLPQEIEQDIRQALKMVKNRCFGLLAFVDSYGNLNKIGQPKLARFSISDMLRRIETLVAGQIKEERLNFIWSVEPQDLTLLADPLLIEQVLINLVKNAIEAKSEITGGKIEIAARVDRLSRSIIEVKDNGSGIVPEALNKIFVPFFSTKKNGTGIGLSLSRQIMRLHNGYLKAQSSPSEETVFSLVF